MDLNEYVLCPDFPVGHLEFVRDRRCSCFPLTLMGRACQSIRCYYLSYIFDDGQTVTILSISY
jgi:hypothetical protein